MHTFEELTPGQAWQQMAQQLPNTEAYASVGFTEEVYWLCFTAHNSTNDHLSTILEVDNPQIDWLNVFQIDAANRITALAATGDKQLFDSRPRPYRTFAIPLLFDSGETKTILLQIDKRKSSLNFPTYLWSEAAFNEKAYHENLGFGFFFGFMILCWLYAMMAFLFLRKSVYGWYAGWIMGTALYLSTALGFSFQYLYPNLLDFNSYFRVYLEVAIFLFLFKFSQSFLNLATLEPVVTRWINYLLWGFALLATISIFSLEFLTEHGIWVVPTINSLLIAGGLLTFFAAIRTWKQQPSIVAFYFTAFGFLLVGYLIMNLSEFGIIPIEDLLVNPVLIGSAIEILIFSIALTFQMRKVYEERNRLSVSLARQQKELLRAYVEGVEKERERIARELHDDIGSRLGSLKRFLDNNSHHSTLQHQIDILCHDVRNMSHQLSPQSLKIAGLRQLITDLAHTTQQNTGIAVNAQFYDWPEELPEETAHHLFRIAQEAVNNAVKHAGATEIDLQFFNHENELVVTIDDNGKGFDTQKNAGGIGLKNIKARVESLQASFEISSTPGQGTSLLIKEVRLAL